MAVIVAAALARRLKDLVREPLRREQQGAARHVDELVARVEPVLERMRDVPAEDGVREVDVGEQNTEDATQAPAEYERPLVLQRVRDDRRTADRSHKIKSDGMRRFVQKSAAAAGDVDERKNGEENWEYGAIDRAQDGREGRNFVNIRNPFRLRRRHGFRVRLKRHERRSERFGRCYRLAGGSDGQLEG